MKSIMMRVKVNEPTECCCLVWFGMAFGLLLSHVRTGCADRWADAAPASWFCWRTDPRTVRGGLTSTKERNENNMKGAVKVPFLFVPFLSVSFLC